MPYWPSDDGQTDARLCRRGHTMSRGRVCDQCGTVLKVNRNGEDADGESAAWLTLTASDETFDFCTRTCAVELLTDPVFIKAQDAYTEGIVAVARSIRGDDEEADDDD